MSSINKGFWGLVTLWVVICILALVTSGCVSDGSGGYRLSFGNADKIEKGLDAGATGLGLLSLFIPGMAGVGGIAAGIAGTFKKMKPQLTKQKAVSEHVVKTIETIKKENPDIWLDIKGKFAEGTNADIDAVIEQIILLNKQVNDVKVAG